MENKEEETCAKCGKPEKQHLNGKCHVPPVPMPSPVIDYNQTFEPKDEPSRSERSLSDKIGFISEQEQWLDIVDVKKAVNKLKDEINKKFDEMREGWFKTDNPEVAQTRMNDSSWINIIDEIDRIFGDDLTK